MPERKSSEHQRIVTIGGGTGHYSLLRGLKRFPGVDLSAIIGVHDSGGVSGEQRVKDSVLPPGDFRQCLLALMPERQHRANMVLLADRSEGAPVGNLLIAKAEKLTHDFKEGIALVMDAFMIPKRHRLVPVTTYEVQLHGETKSGMVIAQEHTLDHRNGHSDVTNHVYFDTTPPANPDALQAIRHADKIIFAPGSIFTSILPALAVEGIRLAILKSRARLVLACNLMSEKNGDAPHINTPSRYLDVVQRDLGDDCYIRRRGRSRIDFLITDDFSNLTERVRTDYANKDQLPMVMTDEEYARCQAMAPGIQILKQPMGVYYATTKVYRHSDELGKTIVRLT